MNVVSDSTLKQSRLGSDSAGLLNMAFLCNRFVSLGEFNIFAGGHNVGRYNGVIPVDRTVEYRGLKMLEQARSR